jgi:hypothetical protein
MPFSSWDTCRPSPFGDAAPTLLRDDRGPFLPEASSFVQRAKYLIEFNIWGAVQEAGFEFDPRTTPYRLLFDEV